MTSADQTAGSEPSTPAMGTGGAGFNADQASGGFAAGSATHAGATQSRLREEAMKLRGQATDKARSAAEDGKARAAAKVDEFARTAHDIAGRLEEQTGPQIGQYAHQAADMLDRLSDGLRTKSVDELLDDARMLIRANPAVAIGVAAAVGFALSRFLKATASDTEMAGGYSRAPSVAPGNAAPRYDA
jgi:ElaB/YqjD/DUF883 family membrane-anchored ribosome-binding protein